MTKHGTWKPNDISMMSECSGSNISIFILLRCYCMPYERFTFTSRSVLSFAVVLHSYWTNLQQMLDTRNFRAIVEHIHNKVDMHLLLWSSEWWARLRWIHRYIENTNAYLRNKILSAKISLVIDTHTQRTNTHSATAFINVTERPYTSGIPYFLIKIICWTQNKWPAT